MNLQENDSRLLLSSQQNVSLKVSSTFIRAVSAMLLLKFLDV